MADPEPPPQSTAATMSGARTGRVGEGPLTEETVRRLIHEEVAAAVATALARPAGGPGEPLIYYIIIRSGYLIKV